MVALPIATPVTKPLAETEAIVGVLLLHVTFLFVALVGIMIGIKYSVSSMPISWTLPH
jgi:1,4-dihydroxy-2-naphthoate octaprenyltransferase